MPQFWKSPTHGISSRRSIRLPAFGMGSASEVSCAHLSQQSRIPEVLRMCYHLLAPSTAAALCKESMSFPPMKN